MTSFWIKKRAVTVAVIATIAATAALAWSADAALAGPARGELYSTNRPGPHNDWGDVGPAARWEMWMPGASSEAPGASSPNTGEDRWSSPDEIE